MTKTKSDQGQEEGGRHICGRVGGVTEDQENG